MSILQEQGGPILLYPLMVAPVGILEHALRLSNLEIAVILEEMYEAASQNRLVRYDGGWAWLLLRSCSPTCSPPVSAARSFWASRARRIESEVRRCPLHDMR
jgi:hypothetical protein